MCHTAYSYITPYRIKRVFYRIERPWSVPYECGGTRWLCRHCKLSTPARNTTVWRCTLRSRTCCSYVICQFHTSVEVLVGCAGAANLQHRQDTLLCDAAPWEAERAARGGQRQKDLPVGPGQWGRGAGEGKRGFFGVACVSFGFQTVEMCRHEGWSGE